MKEYEAAAKRLDNGRIVCLFSITFQMVDRDLWSFNVTLLFEFYTHPFVFHVLLE